MKEKKLYMKHHSRSIKTTRSIVQMFDNLQKSLVNFQVTEVNEVVLINVKGWRIPLFTSLTNALLTC